nr:hypothetical protein CFP56_16769 [Quercus suber]
MEMVSVLRDHDLPDLVGAIVGGRFVVDYISLFRLLAYVENAHDWQSMLTQSKNRIRNARSKTPSRCPDQRIGGDDKEQVRPDSSWGQKGIFVLPYASHGQYSMYIHWGKAQPRGR